MFIQVGRVLYLFWSVWTLSLPLPIHVDSSPLVQFFHITGPSSVKVLWTQGGSVGGSMVLDVTGFPGSMDVHFRSVQGRGFFAPVGKFCSYFSSSSVEAPCH